MAEAIGVASGIVSFAGFAGQIARGVSYLVDFFENVRDAPKDIQILSMQLKTLGSILLDIRDPSIMDAPASGSFNLSHALENCKFWVDKLDGLVRKYQPPSKSSGSMPIWTKMNAAFREKRFSKYIRGLDSAMGLILLARQSNIE
jgi:hypothetical protein